MDTNYLITLILFGMLVFITVSLGILLFLGILAYCFNINKHPKNENIELVTIQHMI